jgi:hypothetical protein
MKCNYIIYRLIKHPNLEAKNESKVKIAESKITLTSRSLSLFCVLCKDFTANKNNEDTFLTCLSGLC